MRVPCIVRWPGRVPAGTECRELATMMDLLPTLATLTGGKLSDRNPIDGKDIWPLLTGTTGARSPHEAFYYYTQDQLQAVRSGPWKLYLPLTQRRARSGKMGKVSDAPRLYDVVNDPGEKQNVIAGQSEIVARLTQLADVARSEIGDAGRPGRGQRPAGWVADPQPQRMP
jgi:arylsulfatase A